MTDRKAEYVLTITITLLLTLLGVACRKPRPQQAVLPEKAPEVVRQEFTDKQEGFPPKVNGRTNVRALAAQELSTSLTDTLPAPTRDAACQDARVRDLLGARIAYIAVGEDHPEQGHS